MTPEIKKGKYIYYHCTGYSGDCDNVYVREESLSELLGDVVKQVYIDREQVEDIRTALLASQKDKVDYHKSSVQALQDREKHLVQLIDRAYEDKLSGSVTEDLWNRKSAAWENELANVRLQQRAHQGANSNYYEFGVQILELANKAYSLFLQQESHEKRRLLNTLLSNCTFYRGTLCPTYKTPFDILAKGSSFESKRGRRGSNSRPPT